MNAGCSVLDLSIFKRSSSRSGTSLDARGDREAREVCQQQKINSDAFPQVLGIHQGALAKA